jgi:hypothetical protein
MICFYLLVHTGMLASPLFLPLVQPEHTALWCIQVHSSAASTTWAPGPYVFFHCGPTAGTPLV